MKKKSNKKGFTIMEMLIVVAIIAVLAAIAIPTFNSALTKSKEAADVANIRAAYAEVQVAILTDDATATEAEFLKALTGKDTGGTAGEVLNYTGNNHGYKFTEAGQNAKAKVEYKANKLKNKDNTGNFEWTFENPSIN